MFFTVLRSQKSYLDDDTEESDTDVRKYDKNRNTRSVAKTPVQKSDIVLKNQGGEHSFSDSGDDDVGPFPSKPVREVTDHRESLLYRRQERYVEDDMHSRDNQSRTPRINARQTKASESDVDNSAGNHSRTAPPGNYYEESHSNKYNRREGEDKSHHFTFSASTPPVAAYSSNQRTPSSSSRPVERVRPHRDITYNPSKADFEKARKLLARSAGNYSTSKK